MRKSILTKMLMLLALVVCLAGTLCVVAFAEDAPAAQAEGDLVLNTRYGEFIVPAASADKAWVSFKADGTFIVASNMLVADESNVLQHDKHSNPKETHYVFLLKDHSNAGDNTGYYNGSYIQSNIIIDLMGHTFTTSNSSGEAAFRARNRASNHVRLTFENGAIHNTSSVPFFFARHDYDCSPHYEFTFNNITFTTTGAATRWFAGMEQGNTQNYRTTFNFNDCTFDFTNLTSSTALFAVGNQNGKSTDTINIKGGTVIGNTNQKWLSITYYKGVTFNLLPDDKGEYLMNKRLTSDETTPRTFVYDGKIGAHTNAVKTEGEYTYYALAEDLSTVEEYPFAVYNHMTGEVVYKQYLNGETEDYALYYVSSKQTGNYEIFLRRDYTATNACNTKLAYAGKLYMHFNLGGHTLTLGNTLYNAYANNPANVTTYYITSNGTINTNAYNVVALGDYYAKKTVNFQFENVDFVNVKGKIVEDNLRLVGTHELTANVDFYDCDFFVADTDNTVLFLLGTRGSVIKVYINIYGGSFTFAGTKTGFYNTQGVTNKSVVMHPDTNGEYPMAITPKVSVQYFGDVIAIPEGNGYFYKVSDNDENSTSIFRLSVQRVPVETKYGEIPHEYTDSNAFPFAIFNATNNTFITATPYLDGESAEYALYKVTKSAAGNYVILMRRDYTTTATNTVLMNNSGLAKGGVMNIVFDLDGHTLTLGDVLYYADAEGQVDQNITIETINGTINCGRNLVVKMGAYYCRKTVNMNFNNVTFTNVQSNLIADNARKAANSNNVTYYNCNFTDCTIEQSASSTASIFNLGNITGYITVTANIYGGTIHASGKQVIFGIGTVGGKTVCFNANEAGAYTTVQTADLSKIGTSAYKTTEKTVLGLRKTAENTYILSPFAITNAFLNITNDLNLVYRVFLPTGYTNPVATFAFDTHTVTVSEYTIDENGLCLFKLTAIGPHRMAEVVTASVSATYNEAIETVTNSTLSVKSYADAVRAQNEGNTELIALLDALLVYGAHAQVYMNHNTDNLVADLGEFDAIPEGLIVKNGTANADYQIVGAGMRLGGAFDFGVQIKAADLTGLTLKITKGGVDTVVTLTEDMKAGDYYVVYYNGLIASELDENVTFALVQNGEQIGKSFTLSANTYLAALQTSENVALSSLTKALYAYGVAAKAFAN